MRTIGDTIPVLEKILAWATTNKDMPLSVYSLSFDVYLFATSTESAREYVAELVRSLGETKKSGSDSCFSFQHSITDDACIRVVTDREIVCTRKVTTKHVPEQVIPASDAKVIPAHDEEVVEWECGSILEPKLEHSTA